MRWKAAESWVTSAEQAHPPLVDAELWERVQLVMAARDPGLPAGTPRSTPDRYVLVGMMTCHHCGRRMQGTDLRGHALYRCRLTNSDYAAAPAGHPSSLNVREDRILRALDRWLVDLFAPDRIDALAAEIVAADEAEVSAPRVAAARRQAVEAQRKIDRHLAALEAGLDPNLVAERTRQAQAELAAAEAVLHSVPPSPEPLTIEEVVATLEAVRALPQLLEEVDQEIRHQVYKSLGINLRYRRDGQQEFVKVDAALKGVDLVCVGGGT